MEIKPTYVTFEQAKFLKEKEFDIKVNGGYNCDGIYHSAKNFLEPYNYNESNKSNDWYSAPEQWQVIEWIRVKHKIHIIVIPAKEKYIIVIPEYPNGEWRKDNEYNNPQEAYSAAFDYIKTVL